MVYGFCLLIWGNTNGIASGKWGSGWEDDILERNRTLNDIPTEICNQFLWVICNSKSYVWFFFKSIH